MLRFLCSLVLGCAVAVLVAVACVLAARGLWPAYAAAEPHKQYTLMMLVARLTAGALSAAAGAWGATVLAGDGGRAAWWLGGLFVILSLPSHVWPGYSWHDYPVWYHMVYLGYLVPVAGVSGGVFCRLRRTLRG